MICMGAELPSFEMRIGARLSKRLRVAGEMGKVTGNISNFRFPNACKIIELRAFIEAGTFIRIDGEMHRLPAYFDNPVGVWASHMKNSNLGRFCT